MRTFRRSWEGTLTVHLRDDNGYQVRGIDLAFLSLSEMAVNDMVSRATPLGMTAAEFSQFVITLQRAAEKDRVTPIDVRLKGSSAHFFSGPHKRMSYGRDTVVRDFELDRARLPEPTELDQILKRLATTWGDPADRPLRRPFDAYWHLGISKFRSDYDIEICSDVIADEARKRIRSLGLDDEYDDRHPEYRFIKKHLVYDVAVSLTAWCALQSDVLRRNVTIAAFPASGPQSRDDGTVTTNQLQPADWTLLKVP